MELIDFSGKKISEIKAEARQLVRDEMLEFLKTKHERVEPIGNTEIGIVVGTAPDDDGWTQDVVVVAKITAKPWYGRDKSSEKSREVKRFDLDAASGGYEE